MSALRLTEVAIQGNKYTYTLVKRERVVEEGFPESIEEHFQVVLNGEQGAMATARVSYIAKAPSWSEDAIPIALTSEMERLIADFRRQANPNGLFRQSVEAIDRLHKTPRSRTFNRCRDDLACFHDPSKKPVAQPGVQWVSKPPLTEQERLRLTKPYYLSDELIAAMEDVADSVARDVDNDGSVDEFVFTTTDNVRVRISNCIVVKGHWPVYPDVHVCGPQIHSDTHETSSMQYLHFVDEALQAWREKKK